MSAYKEFEKIIFGFTMEAAELGGQTAVTQIEAGSIFHFADRDAIGFLEQNAAQLSESTVARLKGNIDATIIAGVKDGKPIKEITKDVHAIFEDARGYESERIARTEVSRGVNNGALVGYGSMGIEIVEYYANAGACSLCAAHHGDLMTIGEAMNYIPLHPNCYCFWLSRPDITNKNVQGWKGLGEIAEAVVKGLGIEMAFRRVSVAPDTMDKIYQKGSKHPNTPEKMRLIVEHAPYGLVDDEGILHLIADDINGGWDIIPIKQTDDMGIVARTAFRNTDKKYMANKIKNAEKTYGL